jgi:hypothetical protein
MIIAWVAMLLFALQAGTHMVGAGDTWVALACGRHFIDHGVDTNEPFSANSHRAGPTAEEIKTWPQWAQTITDKVGLDTVKYWHPTGWINQNWLTHVIFYWLTHLSPFADDKDWSFNTLVYWKFTIYILTVICVYYTGRGLGVNPALSAISACAALFIGRSFLDIRPAGFSNLLVAAFMLTLVLATYRNYLYIWLLVPMTVFWANVHGGYVYVFIMLAPVVVFRLLTMLSRRATVSVYSILTWFALYVAMYKYTSHEPFESISPLQDGMLILLVLFIVGSIVLALRRSMKAPAFYGYHIVVSLIVFVVFFARFFSTAGPNFSPEAAIYMESSRTSFFLAFVAAVGFGIVVTFLKDQLIATTPAAVWHTAAAGAVAFVASIIFNPFHLTNLTHTFVISISQNAEGWRNVHEWWPAFSWDNPVGTAFPYLVMLVVGLGLLVLWLFGRLLVPKMFKGPKTELEKQQKRFNMLAKILGYAAAVLVFWAVLISFSQSDVSLASFLLCGLFVAILWASAFVNVHFIYIIVPFAVFALYTAEAAQGYTGRYIFPFLTIPGYVVMYIVGSQLSNKPRFSIINIFYVLAAAVAALVLAAATVNPFKFQQPVWHVEQFVNLHRMWQPVYEANLDVSYANLFPVIYGINGLCLLAWVLTPLLERGIRERTATTGAEGAGSEWAYQLPKIDLALIAIAALTAYMAFRSRRFITIAGYVGCPVIAMFADQLIQTAAAALNFYRRGRLAVPRMSRSLQRLLTAVAGVTVVSLSVWWGLKFKEVYLDPWPSETKLTSVFIRMTASSAKPFEACQFITANNMQGNMFNYWTEGGFIAWGQNPDPNTGRTPLQLFMDGRAQAAYNYDAYMTWSEIMFGGEIVQLARVRQQNLTAGDYVKIGEWLDSQLKQHNVWVVLMPANQFDMPFVKGLESTRNWQLAFLDDKQKLYVDISTPQGLGILKGIEDGTTRYPEESYRNLVIANNMLLFGRDAEKISFGLECAIKAYEEHPAHLPLRMVQTFYDRYPPLRPRIDTFWKKTLDDFVANQKTYLSHDGYYLRIVGALLATEYLRPAAEKEGNKELVQFYSNKRDELVKMVPSVQDKRW